MRFATLSTPTYSTPRTAGLQAQASTTNMAQSQKAEAFTPSGRLQRQGETTRKHVEMLIDAIDTYLAEAVDADALVGGLLEHCENLAEEVATLEYQLATGNYTVVGAYLVGLDLRNADLRKADLRWAQLQGAKLKGAKLQGADLRGAILRKADLRWAQLQGAILDLADLRKAKLWFARFQAASLEGANLQDADLLQIPFLGNPLKDADLKGAFGYVHGLKSRMLEGAKNTDLLGDFMRNYWNPKYRMKYQKLEQERQANVRALLGLG
ncbi:MAG: pentapeptide repeat-containing protein [Vampirovibrionales bacterium]